jgi:hypothetical protein
MRSGLFEVYDSPEFNHMNVTPTMTFGPRTIVRWTRADHDARAHSLRAEGKEQRALGLVTASRPSKLFALRGAWI